MIRIGHALLLLLSLSFIGCASGNWMRFRPEHFETADPGNHAVIRAQTYDALTKVQALSSKGQHVDALDRIQDLESQVNDVPHEQALVQQAKAYVLMTMGRLHEAPAAIEKALAPGTLPEQTSQDLRYNLVQIYVQQEAFGKAAPVLEHWVSQSERPEPEAVALLAYIYFQQREYKLAASYAKRAIKLRPDHDDWRKILLGCQFELKQYAQARETLLELLGRAPTNAEHWRALNQVDLLLEHPADALVSQEIFGDVSTLGEQEILQLARLSLLQALPARGARLLVEALRERRIADRAEHWKLLGHAQLAAKNFEGAMQAFEQSQRRQKDPARKAALCLRLAGLAMRLGKWSEAQAQAECAAKSSSPQLAANAWLIEGIASYQAREFDRSLTSLSAAQREPTTRQSARQWEEMVRAQAHNLDLAKDPLSSPAGGLAR